MGVVLAWQPVRAVAVDAHVRTARENAGFQLVPERRQLHGLVRHAEARQLAGLRETDDVGDVLRARAARTLLVPAQHEGLELRAPADVEDSNALGGVELVAGHREHVDRHLLHVDRDLSRDLHRVRMEDRPVRLADLRDLLNGKQNARLVVGPHDRDKCLRF